MSGRLERLQELVAELEADALLVTNATNVLYLTGFASSNAAVLATAGHAWLLTDGRYVEAARAVEGVEVVRAERDLYGDLGRQLPALAGGPVAFEAEHVTVAQHARLSSEGATLVQTRKVVEGLRAVKEEPELEAVRRSTSLLNEAFEGFARRACRRPHGGRARMVDGAGDPGAGSRGRQLPADRGERPERGAPAPSSRRPCRGPGRDAARGRGSARRRLLLGLHADVRHR